MKNKLYRSRKESAVFFGASLAWMGLTTAAFANFLGLGTAGNLELSIIVAFGVVILVVALGAFLRSEISRLSHP